MRKVFVFGTFDGIHEGHRAFFRQARAHGDQLVVAVAQDSVVERLKERPAKKSLHERMEALHDEDLVDFVVPGDVELGSYAVVRQYKPDVIALGYDQHGLKADIMENAREFDWAVEIVMLESHEPEKYHNSLL